MGPGPGPCCGGEGRVYSDLEVGSPGDSHQGTRAEGDTDKREEAERSVGLGDGWGFRAF